MSDPRKIFFIHIPKTGGVSIEKSLKRNFSHKVCPAYEDKEFFDLENKHDYEIYCGHLRHYISHIIRPDLKFTIMRDPIERAMSAFEHIRRDKNHPAHKMLSEAPTIAQALQHPALRGHFSNPMTLYLGLKPIFDDSQNDYSAVIHALKNSDMTTMLKSAKAVIEEELDYIGFTEVLDNSQREINSILKLEPCSIFKPTKENVNPSKTQNSYAESLSEDELDLLIQANTYDIELYDFARETARKKGWPVP